MIMDLQIQRYNNYTLFQTHIVHLHLIQMFFNPGIKVNGMQNGHCQYGSIQYLKMYVLRHFCIVSSLIKFNFSQNKIIIQSFTLNPNNALSLSDSTKYTWIKRPHHQCLHIFSIHIRLKKNMLGSQDPPHPLKPSCICEFYCGKNRKFHFVLEIFISIPESTFN